MSPASYSLYGLCIRSELPLSAPPASAGTGPDLTVLLGEELSAQAGPPPGDVWANAEFGNGFGVWLTKTAGGWSLFYRQTGEFRLSADLRLATAHALPGRADILPLLLAGSVPSWVLNLHGVPILHASAVRVGHDALAFIGASGMGKTTLATLLCSVGAQMVTDDVLRLTRQNKHSLCHHGTGELRLREGAAALAERFAASPPARSADQRLTLQLGSEQGEMPALRAIVIPQPSRTLTELTVKRLSAVAAGFHLNGYARVYGWQQDAPLRRQFELFSALASQVPLYRAHIPWGPPFAAGLPRQLAAACGLNWTSLQSPE